MTERIDINELLNRVDINALMQRVDLDALIEQSNLGGIIAESSSGVCSAVMDTLRVEIINTDLILLGAFHCNQKYLPPGPGKVDRHTPFQNDSKIEKAIEVQEHYCNIFSKTLALGIDWLILFTVSAIISLVVEAAFRRVYELFVRPEEQKEIDFEDSIVVIAITACVWFLYFWVGVALTGQTVGMSVVGLRVVQSNGQKQVPWGRAALRTIALLVVVICWPITIWCGIIRRDGRMPHDLLCCTGLIFKWNATLAYVREKNARMASARQRERGAEILGLVEPEEQQPLRDDDDEEMQFSECMVADDEEMRLNE